MITPVLPTYARAKVAFERGEGVRVFTPEGESYLDFGAGVAVTSCGHSHPHLVQALTEQAQKIWHTSNLYQMPGQEKLAQRLIDASFADTVFFTNSGAEALECSIKMARKYHAANGHPEKYRLITFEGAFHGRTLATIAAGGQAKYLEGFGPKVEGFDQVPFGDHEALKAAITPETAGILIEPVQGEGGIRPVPTQCLKGLRELCDAHGILLIFDEVQCGIGRTGKFFAYEHAGVKPDAVAMAKGLGGGFPIGAIWMAPPHDDLFQAGSHGTTFGGGPLAATAGLAVLEILEAEQLVAKVADRSVAWHAELRKLVALRPDLVKEVRGAGYMVGVILHVDPLPVVAALREAGILTAPAGGVAVRLLPPLNASPEELAESVAILRQVLGAWKTA